MRRARVRRETKRRNSRLEARDRNRRKHQMLLQKTKRENEIYWREWNANMNRVRHVNRTIHDRCNENIELEERLRELEERLQRTRQELKETVQRLLMQSVKQQQYHHMWLEKKRLLVEERDAAEVAVAKLNLKISQNSTKIERLETENTSLIDKLQRQTDDIKKQTGEIKKLLDDIEELDKEAEAIDDAIDEERQQTARDKDNMTQLVLRLQKQRREEYQANTKKNNEKAKELNDDERALRALLGARLSTRFVKKRWSTQV